MRGRKKNVRETRKPAPSEKRKVRGEESSEHKNMLILFSRNLLTEYFN